MILILLLLLLLEVVVDVFVVVVVDGRIENALVVVKNGAVDAERKKRYAALAIMNDFLCCQKIIILNLDVKYGR